MTNEQLFEDLKQFIAATVTQQTSDIRGDIAQVTDDLTEVKGKVATIDSKVEKLRQEISDGFAGIAVLSKQSMRDFWSWRWIPGNWYRVNHTVTNWKRWRLGIAYTPYDFTWVSVSDAMHAVVAESEGCHRKRQYWYHKQYPIIL
jgi:hypothetical protein